MSVKELVLIGLGPNDLTIKEKEIDDYGNPCKDEYEIVVCNRKSIHAMCAVLDRNQAHLLKIWLEEHLK